MGRSKYENYKAPPLNGYLSEIRFRAQENMSLTIVGKCFTSIGILLPPGGGRFLLARHVG